MGVIKKSDLIFYWVITLIFSMSAIWGLVTDRPLFVSGTGFDTLAKDYFVSIPVSIFLLWSAIALSIPKFRKRSLLLCLSGCLGALAFIGVFYFSAAFIVLVYLASTLYHSNA